MNGRKDRENRASSRISYGFADIYGGGAFVVISTFYTAFLTKALGMPPPWRAPSPWWERSGTPLLIP